MTRMGYPGTSRRGQGLRGAETQIGSRNLGGYQCFDPDNAHDCICGEEPKWEWRSYRSSPSRGTGRFVCVCGRVSGWCETKRQATLDWNENARPISIANFIGRGEY